MADEYSGYRIPQCVTYPERDRRNREIQQTGEFCQLRGIGTKGRTIRGFYEVRAHKQAQQRISTMGVNPECEGSSSLFYTKPLPEKLSDDIGTLENLLPLAIYLPFFTLKEKMNTVQRIAKNTDETIGDGLLSTFHHDCAAHGRVKHLPSFDRTDHPHLLNRSAVATATFSMAVLYLRHPLSPSAALRNHKGYKHKIIILKW